MSKGKAYLVRVPESELEAIEAVLRQFPGASPSLLFRAVLLAASRIGVTNALAKHAAAKVRKGRDET